ncbi:unnamed protein product, partial [marine sediment metagenome]
SQQLGKALVYFPWKGLNVVREYVIPSNPQTTAQNTQRGYVTAAVAAIHAAQGRTTGGLAAIDVQAYALWASVVQAATTWFNQAVKNWLDQKVAGKIPVIFRDMAALPKAGGLNVKGDMTEESSTVVSGALYYGTSKTALVNSKACAKVQLQGTMPIDGLTAGVKYYVQYRCTGPAGFIGSNSGIYYGRPT